MNFFIRLFLKIILLPDDLAVVISPPPFLHFSLWAVGPFSAASICSFLQWPKDPSVPDPVHSFFFSLLALSNGSKLRQSADGAGDMAVMHAQQDAEACRQDPLAGPNFLIQASSSTSHLALRVVFVQAGITLVSHFSFAEEVQFLSLSAIAWTVALSESSLAVPDAVNSPALALSLFFSMVEQVLLILLSFLS